MDRMTCNRFTTPAIAAAVAAILAGTPAIAATPAVQSGNQAGNQSGNNSSARTETTPQRITVASAEDLTGRVLRDAQGRDAGRIEAIVVDLEQGRALYALVGSNGSFDVGNSYVPVPFSALKLARNDAMNVTIAADKLAKAPRATEGQLGEYGGADRVGTVYGFYGIPTPLGYVVPPGGRAAAHSGRFTLIRPGEAVPLAPGGEFAKDLRSETVKAHDGSDAGSIEHVMIDSASGRIAYLLLSRGGLLGIGEEWVPAQALSWSDKDDAYVLKSGPTDPKQRQGLQKADVPNQVRRDQLQSLYESYGVKPFWQQG